MPLSAAILVCSLKKKSRKRLACDVLHTFTTNAGIVYDLSFEKEEQKRLAFFMIPLIQAAECTMAMLTVVFLQLSNDSLY